MYVLTQLPVIIYHFTQSFVGKYFQMSSFSEPHAFKYRHTSGVDFVQYNKRQLSRIYPAGTRIDSSNYDPIEMWNMGCQIGEYIYIIWTMATTVDSTNIWPLSLVSGILISPSPFRLKVHQWQTSDDLELRSHICHIHLLAILYNNNLVKFCCFIHWTVVSCTLCTWYLVTQWCITI